MDIALKDLTLEHVAPLFKIISHPDFFYPYINQKKDGEEINLQRAANEYCQLAEDTRLEKPRNSWLKGIFNKKAELIGACVLVEMKDMPDNAGKEAEIGFFVRVEDQHKGIASKAAIRLITEAKKKFGLTHLRATVDPKFSYSQATLKKLGLSQSGSVERSSYNDRDGNNRPRLFFTGRA